MFAVVVLSACVKKKSSVASQEAVREDTFTAAWKVARAWILRSKEPLEIAGGGSVRFGFEKEGSTTRIFRVATSKVRHLGDWLKEAPSEEERRKVLELITSPDFLTPTAHKEMWAHYREALAFSGARNDGSDQMLSDKIRRISSLAESRSLEDEVHPAKLRQFAGQIPQYRNIRNFENLVPPKSASRHIESLSHGQRRVWEVRFQPGESLAAFEEQVTWFGEITSRTSSARVGISTPVSFPSPRR